MIARPFSPLPPRKGLGSNLARLFKFFGIKQKPRCGCFGREMRLNGIGTRLYFTYIRLWNAVLPFWPKSFPPVNKRPILTSCELAKRVAAYKADLSAKNL